MREDHVRYAQWDAAYLVGALAPSERHEFEAHLSLCSDCQRAVAELAPTVALLSRVTPPSGGQEPRVPPSVRDADASRAALIDIAHERSGRRRARLRWGIGVAAVTLAMAGVALPLTVWRPAAPATAMHRVSDVPITASLTFESVPWGTRILMDCAYPDIVVADVPEDGWVYSLAVIGVDGTTSTVANWRARPGAEATLAAASALELADISAVEIHSAKGDVLMRVNVTS